MGILSNVILGGAKKLGKDLNNLTVGNVKKGVTAAKGYIAEIKAEAAEIGYNDTVEQRALEKMADKEADLMAEAAIKAKLGK